MIDLSRCRLPPYKHQVEGIERLTTHTSFALFDEMGAGKTLQVIVAAQLLAILDKIDRVVIVAPAAVRAVWFDPELGELAKHLFAYFAATITEYHSKPRQWNWFVDVGGTKFTPQLKIIITNYDFIRQIERLKPLRALCNAKTLLVLDESSAVKSWKALQTKACEELRKVCGRIILLNGTPIANNPGDLYSQMHLLDPKILACKSYFHFRARYAIMGGWQQKQIVAWRDIPDLQARIAPYVLRRLKEQCLDLPPKIDSVIISVPMTGGTWKIYKEMRDDMVAWLNDSTLSAASQAIVKAIRLAQITSGFLGGVEYQDPIVEDIPDFVEVGPGTADSGVAGKTPPDSAPRPNNVVEEIGREKLDAFLSWLEERLEVDPGFKVLVWCRFRPEVVRMGLEVAAKFPKIAIGKIWGGQKPWERAEALRLLDPRTAPKGPVVVIGTPASGSMGLNLTAAHTVIYISNDFSLKTRLQSEDRVHRPGQTYPVSYFDMIATGPQGQKTIDHMVVKALKAKEDVANFTTSAWIAALSED